MIMEGVVVKVEEKKSKKGNAYKLIHIFEDGYTPEVHRIMYFGEQRPEKNKKLKMEISVSTYLDKNGIPRINMVGFDG